MSPGDPEKHDCRPAPRASLDVPVCYCFNYTPRKIFEEIKRTGKSTAVQEITRRVKAGECACEIKNPKGTCCLSDVGTVVSEGMNRRATASSAGPTPTSTNLGLLASFFASLCCVGPLVAVSLGLGGVGLAAFFGKYHWLWLALAAALLTAGWIRYRRDSRAACGDGCDLAGGRRTRNILLAATVVLIFFAAVNAKPYMARSASPGADSTIEGETAVIPVEGVVCYTCEIALKSAMNGLPGVLAVDANANEGRVTVRFDPKLTSQSAIEAKIRETGYRPAAAEGLDR